MGMLGGIFYYPRLCGSSELLLKGTQFGMWSLEYLFFLNVHNFVCLNFVFFQKVIYIGQLVGMSRS